ncbi:MAG: hypothetical protein ABI779_18220 [Acidobacteriota bacterium]
MRKTLPVAGLVLALTLAGCAHQTPPLQSVGPAPMETGAIVVPAAPERGFHFPYILRIPADPSEAQVKMLLVEPNNTGAVSDDPEVHAKAAMTLSGTGIGADAARNLHIPLLMPVFPRPESEWRIYTHQLDRDSMLVQSGPLRRLDLQLIAMIDDARARLRERGMNVPARVLMTGFSASGSFVNRFTMLHPDRVQAVATGGLNGLLILPQSDLDSISLPYPLGLADLEQVAGIKPRMDEWRRIPQLIFMGALDDNDAVLFDDGYDESEKELVFRAIGETMQPDRWERCQAAYRAAGANATFRTYDGIGHGTDGRIGLEITSFLRDASTNGR